LFDSFEGFPEFSSQDPSSWAAEFRDTSLSAIRALFAQFPTVQLHAGYFSQTLPSVANDRFAIVYVDCDLYEATLECCSFFYDRLQPGGIMLFHDYSDADSDLPHLPVGVTPPFTGVRKAAEEFFADRAVEIVEFPETTHAVVVKR